MEPENIDQFLNGNGFWTHDEFRQLISLLWFGLIVLVILVPVGIYVYRRWHRYHQKDVKYIPMKDGGTLIVQTDADGTSYTAVDAKGEEIERKTVTYESEYNRLLRFDSED